MPPVSLAPRAPTGQLWALSSAMRNLASSTVLFNTYTAAVEGHLASAQVALIDLRPLEKIEPALAPLDAIFDSQHLAEQPRAQRGVIGVIAAVIEVDAIIIVETHDLRHRPVVQRQDAELEQADLGHGGGQAAEKCPHLLGEELRFVPAA